jgi:ribosomal protein S18 acetylase RimI-like enzyme
MIVRPLVPADLEACAAIMAANPLWQRYGVTRQSAYERLSAGHAQGADLLVAEVEGQVAGFIWYSLKGAFQRSGYILLVGVSPSFQNQGAGQALMDAAEAAIFAQSADAFLLVSDFNAGAQRFYRRRGYAQVGVLPDYVLPGVAELIFRKRRVSFARQAAG